MFDVFQEHPYAQVLGVVSFTFGDVMHLVVSTPTLVRVMRHDTGARQFSEVQSILFACVPGQGVRPFYFCSFYDFQLSCSELIL